MNKEKTIVLGRGFLGKEFERMGYKVLGRKEFNYTPTIYPLLKLSQYDTIINCIGNADTRACEDPKNWNSVYSVNAKLVADLSLFCRSRDKKFVHISTGCVYDKNDRPQKETDFVSSHCRYVVSKLAAEYFCSENDLIIRPRLFFSDVEDKNNLLTKLPKFEKHLTELNSFTSTRTIVEAVTALLEAEQKGIFNVAQKGFSTVKEICRVLGLPEKPDINGAELQKDQGLALVNNIMDISKLEEFYKPREIIQEIQECWGKL
jgi:dTDP-4-dehydrorhamnose reductase